MTEKMDVLEIVLPVLVMIILGMLCRKWKLLDQNGVNNIKTLITNIMLPVAIFHALATAKYSGKIGTLVLIMFIMLLISFGVGFLLLGAANVVTIFIRNFAVSIGYMVFIILVIIGEIIYIKNVKNR